ncbi:hypothetical protein NKJ23_32255 [Mesorhizobium sp. M0184]|uniref:hypothetical protein n=1 Tax=Mesorhizobium sp. M0184 TaxID=2956906 RepID=UPI0033359DC0
MGAVAVTSEQDVWGASRSFIRRMLDHFIVKVGRKPYLILFKEAFDDGYNSFSLYDLPHDEYMEFLHLVEEYAKEKELSSNESEISIADIKLINDLAERMRKGIHGVT